MKKKKTLNFRFAFSNADIRLFGPFNDSLLNVFQAKKGVGGWGGGRLNISCPLSVSMCKPKQTGNRWRRQPLRPATSSSAGWPAGTKQVGHDYK